MERFHKIWGERYLLRQDSTHALSFLDLITGTCCSWHKHETKFNFFFLIEGSVSIKTEFGETLLEPGQIFTVEPGTKHQFVVHEDSKLLEEMYVEYAEADIQRETLGSKL